MEIVTMKRALLKVSWRRRRALRSAQLLDDVVDAQAGTLPELPEDMRRSGADHLAELVMLAQAYRAYAAGHLSHKELRRRGWSAVDRLESIRRPRMEQLTERE